MHTATVVAQSPYKRPERAFLAVDVPNDVEGAATEGLDKLRHTATSHGSEGLADWRTSTICVIAGTNPVGTLN